MVGWAIHSLTFHGLGRRPLDRLRNLVWLCTRAYDKRFVYSLGDGKAHPCELTQEEAKTFVKGAAEFGVDYFFVTGGGDPLVRRDILDLARYASEFGMAPYIKTDGWRINEIVANRLASFGAKIIVSIAGLRDVDEMLRGQGAYERSIAAAKLCADHGMLTSLSVVNTKHVVCQIRDLVSLAQELNSQGFSLASLMPQPICVEEQREKLLPLEPTPEQHERELNDIYVLSKEKGNDIKIMAYDIFYNRIVSQNEPNTHLRSRCSLCHNLESNEWLDVLDDGKAYGCSTLGLMFGDVRKDRIGHIMDRIRSSYTVQRLSIRRNLTGKCGICEFNSVCGGCRARAYVCSGNMFGSDPSCPYVPCSAVNS
jgi:radical SAM protein with 4Fe4S-binding SPASM domain